MKKTKCLVERKVRVYPLASGWNKKKLTFFLENEVTGFSRITLLQIIKSCFRQWSRATRLKFQYSRTNADIIIKFIRIDGPSNTLGQATFPQDGGDIEMDNSELWVNSATTDSNKADIYHVLLHEIGHALGLEHTSNAADVMYDDYVYPSPRRLSRNDIREAKKIYP